MRVVLESPAINFSQQSAIVLAKVIPRDGVSYVAIGILRLRYQAPAKFADVRDAYENSFREKRQLFHGILI